MEAIGVRLRRRILADCDAGLTMAAAAEKFSVSLAFVKKLKKQRRETGSIEPRRPGGCRPRALAAGVGRAGRGDPPPDG